MLAPAQPIVHKPIGSFSRLSLGHLLPQCFDGAWIIGVVMEHGMAAGLDVAIDLHKTLEFPTEFDPAERVVSS